MKYAKCLTKREGALMVHSANSNIDAHIALKLGMAYSIVGIGKQIMQNQAGMIDLIGKEGTVMVTKKDTEDLIRGHGVGTGTMVIPTKITTTTAMAEGKLRQKRNKLQVFKNWQL